ncbi:hypothetical protein SAMN06265222_110177 [Neorhodopirellula lusitana]|uniref:Uncharacterized protein n=1 Tax=Neorhodopirellula lusitana TaxID=445327 RepID=A0ABY1QDN6_9BACT|nr:hypothetical protein SAMN06265222_110177 [Neorhodopirellula lusitana]
MITTAAGYRNDASRSFEVIEVDLPLGHFRLESKGMSNQ